MTFKVGVLSQLSVDLDLAFTNAYFRAKTLGEKNNVKTLAHKQFLDEVEGFVDAQLASGWKAKVAGAYVDTHPRVHFKSTDRTGAEIEIGDILFCKTVHPLGVERPDEGRAWLVQAKSTADQQPAPPPITGASQGPHQHEFSLLWPRFRIPPAKAKFNVRIDVADLDLPALEWWAAAWNDPSNTPPAAGYWSGVPWITCDASGNGYQTFGSALANFLSDSVSVGHDYDFNLRSQSSDKGWSALVSALLEYCRDRKVKPGHDAAYGTDHVPRIAVSSWLMRWAQSPRFDTLVDIRIKEANGAPGPYFDFDRAVAGMHDGAEEHRGFLLVHVYLVQLAST